MHVSDRFSSLNHFGWSGARGPAALVQRAGRALAAIGILLVTT